MQTNLFARHAAVAVLAAMLGACASAPPAGPSPVSFSVPYSTPSFGAGPQPVSGDLQLHAGREQEAVGWAIVDALQRMQLSLIEPQLRAADTLPAGKPWKTDVASLDADAVLEHNRRFPAIPLPADRIYGIQYSGEYAVLEHELRFRLESTLYQRGAGSAFRAYDGREYSGVFFFERARDRIAQSLKQAGRPPEP